MKAIVTVKKSERFPNKHKYLIGGKTLLDMLLTRLRSVDGFDEIIVFSKDDTIRSELATIINDESEGIITDSIYSLIQRFGEFFVFAGDMPVVSAEFIETMLDSYAKKPLCPIHKNGTIEPLHTIYNMSIEKDFRQYLAGGGESLYKFIQQSDFEYIEIGERYEDNFLNINHAGDIEKLRIFLDKTR